MNKSPKKIIELAVNQYFDPNFKRERAKILTARILHYTGNAKTFVDIGCGDGQIAYLLKREGKKVTPVDIKNLTDPKLNLKVTLYNGRHLPFANKKFDVGLLIFSLHHDKEPIKVLEEAIRVSREVLVMEVSYGVGKILFKLIDGVQNSHNYFLPFWNSYQTHEGWLTFFKKHNFQVLKQAVWQDFPDKHTLYLLRPLVINQNNSY